MGHPRFGLLSHDWARWALVAAPVLLGVAVLVSGWTMYHGVQQASASLLRGQADALFERVVLQLMELPRPVPEADLLGVLADLQDEGLTSLRLISPDGRAVAEAGEPLGTRVEPLLALPPGQPLIENGRALVVFRGPPGRAGRRRFRGRPMPMLVLAFEPRMAMQLKAAAARTLGVGALAALVFVALALAGARWSYRRQQRALEAEHAERLGALGQMSAVLAHEIRNPLASLKGNAQLLARALPEGARERSKADRVVSEAVRLEALTNDLLDFVRRGDLQCVDVDPTRLLQTAAETLDVNLSIDDTQAPTVWRLDPQRLNLVLTNLLRNAHEANPQGVCARVAQANDRLLIEIRDRGPGVAPSDLSRIFEPFFTRRTQGTGLGLAVAKRMVDLHEGQIEVRNASEGGAVFRIWLPRGQRQEAS